MRTITYTHGNPTDPIKCGRPVTARFDTNNPERVVGWTCLLHGELTAGPEAEVAGTAVQHPRISTPPVDDQVRDMFRELREGLRAVVEELRQDAFPPMVVNATRDEFQRDFDEAVALRVEALARGSGATTQDALVAALAARTDAALEREERISRRAVTIEGTFESMLPSLCPVRSSITGGPCMLEEGHAEWRPTRFHKYETPVTGSAESEPDVVFRQRRPE